MSIYTVTLVGKNGKRLTGSPVRKYNADDARTAGALYVAGQGMRGATFAGGDAGFYTFNPPAEGAPMRVLVELVDDEPDATPVQGTVRVKDVWRCGRHAARSGLAKRDAFGYIEVPQVDVDHARTMGTSLFRIVD